MKLFPDQTLLARNSTKWLAYLYGLSGLFGLTVAICFAIVWSHWHSTLNGCYSSDCGCCLYVTTTPGTITGSNIMVCWFITYTHLAVGLGSCGMLCAYCVKSMRQTQRMARMRYAGEARTSRNGNRTVYTGQKEDPCSSPLALISGLVSVLLLSTAYMFTEGYIKTCSEYRTTVSRNLKASGNLVDLITSRLSCSSILDVMDFTQPNTRLREPRGGIINTASLLQGSGLLIWGHFVVWAVLLVYNTVLARRRLGNGWTKSEISQGSETLGVKDEKNLAGLKGKKKVLGVKSTEEPLSVKGTETSI